MRIGLDFRFLSVGQQNVVRGIPRFTQEQLQAVLAIDRDGTYLLLCDPGDDLGAIRPEIRAAPNAHIVCAPDAAPPAFGPNDDMRTLLARYSAYQRWVEGLNLDLYHATCHFWISRLIMPGFDVCPYVVTAYDLMPLLYPIPVQGEPMDAYQRGLLFLEQASRVAAISQATADAVVDNIGVPPDRIDVTRPAISSCFRPIPRDVARSILESLDHPARHASRRRVRIPPQYMLSVTDLHFTKNLVTLLAAYAELPTSTRSQFPLVIAGQLGQGGVETVQRYATSLNIERDLVITGRVSDHELLALYNGATIMVHPSHHEGFGLTVAEAMRCGTPVITTTRSALPEVAGDAAVLVDSEDRSAFTEAIELLVHDRELRDDLRRRGRVQAARFTAAALGQATLDCYRKAVSTGQSATPKPLRVALWSPIAPQSSGVSEHTTDLVSGLSSQPGLQLDIFVDDGVMPPLDLLRMARVHHWSDFDRCARRATYDAAIYQLGASPIDCYMEQAVFSQPGIVVLHDLRRGRLAAVVDAAACCVALTPAAAAELHRRYPKADVRVLPIGVRDPWPDGFGFDRVMARAYLDVDPNAFVVVVPRPFVTATHVETVMNAVAELRRTGANMVLAVVGWSPDAVSASMLPSRVAGLDIDDALRVTGPVPHSVFDAYLAASDAVIVLGDGASQAALGVMRALAAGRCVVVSDIPDVAAIPDSACIRVAAPPQERAALTAALSGLLLDSEQRRDLERRARTQYEATAPLDRMVDGYVSLIRERAGRDLPQHVTAAASATRSVRHARAAPSSGPLPYSKVCELEDFAHAQLRDVIREVCPHKRAAFGAGYPRGYEHRQDWEAAMAVRTLSGHGILTPDARVLGVAPGTPDTCFYLTRHVGEVVAIDDSRLPSSETGSLRHPVAPFAFRAERLTVRHMDARDLGYPDASFDAVVGRLPADITGDLHDVGMAVHEMGRVLKPGGILSLSTEILLSSDPGSDSLPPRSALLSSSEVQRFIVDASGLEPVDELYRSVSHWTLSTVRDIVAARAACQARTVAPRYGSRFPEWTGWDLPLIVLARDGRRYTSVHLALRRAPSLPA